MKTLKLLAAGFVAASMAAVPAYGQSDWPTKTVKIVNPSAPGGGSDFLARLIADLLATEYGQSFVVENIEGAGNTIGTAAVAKADPDGYTLLVASPSAITVAPHFRKDLAYDPLTDLAPISLLAETASVLLVNPNNLDVNTAAELIAELKAKPGEYDYGTSGAGGVSHLLHELFQLRTGTKITHVPFESNGETSAALLGGHIDLAFLSRTNGLPFARDKSLRLIAVTGSERLEEFPDIPTMTEVEPTFVHLKHWYGMYAPAGTPKEILDKISGSIAKAVQDEEVKQKIASQDVVAVGSTPEALDVHMRTEYDTWKEVSEKVEITE